MKTSPAAVVTHTPEDYEAMGWDLGTSFAPIVVH